MNKLINDCLTEKNNKRYDIVRVIGSFGFFVYLLLAIIELYRSSSDFSLSNLATGMSMLLGVIAAGVTIKSKSEK